MLSIHTNQKIVSIIMQMYINVYKSGDYNFVKIILGNLVRENTLSETFIGR